MKVLIVDDDETMQLLWSRMLVRENSTLIVLQAYNFQSARELFQEHKPDIIVLDGNVEGLKGDSIPLAKEFNEIFDGPMIANSSDQENNQMLVNAGCTHLNPDKTNCHEFILAVIEELSK